LLLPPPPLLLQSLGHTALSWKPHCQHYELRIERAGALAFSPDTDLTTAYIIDSPAIGDLSTAAVLISLDGDGRRNSTCIFVTSLLCRRANIAVRLPMASSCRLVKGKYQSSVNA